MMAQAKLPEHYWAEAVATAAYLRNRVPTRSLKSTTPFEKWYNRKPNLSHVRVFGCIYVLCLHPRGEQEREVE